MRLAFGGEIRCSTDELIPQIKSKIKILYHCFMSQNKKIYFLVFFISAFLIRLISLNQSLWLDEATTAKVVQQYNLLEIITKFSANDFHPPLYYLVMKIWTNVFGYSEIALRIPSVLFSLLTGCLVSLLGKRIKDENTGIWAAAFFLFNPLIVYYSQEARMYMMATMLLTASLFFLLAGYPIRQVQGKLVSSIKNMLLFSVFSALSILTFYGSIFFIAPMVFYLLYKKQWRAFSMLLLLITFTLLLLSPLLYRQISNAQQQVQLVPNWSSVLGTANLKNLFLIPLKFSIGRISFEPKLFYYLISVIWSFFVFFFVIIGGLSRNSNRKFNLLFYLLISPIILGILFSFFSPLLQYFRFLYLVPIMSVLLAMGGAKFHRVGGMWLVLTGFIIWSLVYLLNPNFHREDWKSLVKSLPKKARVFMVASSSDPVKYYKNDLTVVDLKNLPEKIKDQEFYVIPYTADIHGIDYVKILGNRNFILIGKESFRGLILEKWGY